MRGGNGRVVTITRRIEPKSIIVGVVSEIHRELVFAHVPGNVPVPRVGDEVVLIAHPKSGRLTANRMRAV